VNLDSQQKSSGPSTDQSAVQAPHQEGHSAAAFYRRRNLFYLALMAFILVAGLPQLLIPSLRQRLQERGAILRENLSGRADKPRAVTAQVGENPVPFPEEYERVIQPLPQLPPQVFTQNRIFRPMPGEPAPKRSGAVSTKTGSGTEDSKEATDRQDADSAQAEPEFQQGKMEQEAYDILIQTNTVAAGLIRPGNSLGKFSGWAAAKLDEDTYLVRITLVKDGTDVPYIWQVRLGTKQNAPLNFNARSLPKP
jgi:hypothetical protein